MSECVVLARHGLHLWAPVRRGVERCRSCGARREVARNLFNLFTEI